MLETKNLCKKYTPKKGVPVQAVDHVSIRFPEKGMVFLLGKSGSGKSTMLNLLGGLDQYDEGEIIIKGISSKDFTQQRFDSYRNTYVGFIFQEYNVLEEFTVGANIALALELQGKTATDDELNAILKEVDLEGFGDRKPNELSGGQKQRVAIARALVKKPEIIMADEPTGALDSNTGRQVLDTLKKLSAEKLVVVVSHDREYAEQYADRIIELADGKVIRDVEAVHDADDEADKKLVFRATSIEIPPAYHLTEEDRIQINKYLDDLRTGASVMLPSSVQRFVDTDTEKIPVQDGSDFHLIKSVLPMASAFKIGKSSLKHKRFRLVMTILLSVAAFTLFALVDTFSSYDHIRTCTESLVDSDVAYLSANRSKRMGSGLDTWWVENGLQFSKERVEEFSRETGLDVCGLYIPPNADLSFDGQFGTPKHEADDGSDEMAISMRHFCGFAEITQEMLDQYGYKLINGRLPDGDKDEIAVSAALCQTFIEGGYHEPMDPQNMPRNPRYQTISSPIGMVNRTIRLMGVDYTITGVIETNFDLSRYERLKTRQEGLTVAEELVNSMLMSELHVNTNYSLTGAAMVGKGKIDAIAESMPKIFESVGYGSLGVNNSGDQYEYYSWPDVFARLEDVPPEDIVWCGDAKTKLEKNEVILSLNSFDVYSPGRNNHSDAEDLLYNLREGKKELTKDSLNELLAGAKEGKWTIMLNYRDEDGFFQQDENKKGCIVGCVKPASAYGGAMVIADEFAQQLEPETDGFYDSVIAPMPQDRAAVEQAVRYCYHNDEDVKERYVINHAVTYELDTIDNVLKVLSKVFFYIGLGFAVFAALLMANFISTSIHYKRQEIGILRAIGSRSADVFRIFFSESFIIAMINFVLSAIFCFIAVTVINYFARRSGILVTVLHFGIRQIVLLLLVSVAVAAVASFLPVHRIASKRPIDAIRDK